MPTAKEVYSVIKNNGAVPGNRRPSEKQLRFYAQLIEETGARFDVSQYAKDSYTGITSHRISKLIEYLLRQKA